MATSFARRITVIVALLLACATTFGAPTANAGLAWCRVDPIVVIDGQLADVFIASTLSMQLQATGPVQMVISLPPGSTGYVLLTDTGFGLRGYQISFESDSTLSRGSNHTQVRIAAYAPAIDSSLPVKVTFAPRSLNSSLGEILFGTSADGTANSWTYLTTK